MEAGVVGMVGMAGMAETARTAETAAAGPRAGHRVGPRAARKEAG